MKNILKTILLAVVAAALAVVAEQILAVLASIFGHPEIVLDFYPQLTWFLIAAAVIEESLKYWAVYFVIRQKFELQKIPFIFSALLLGAVWGAFEAGLTVYSGQNIPVASTVPMILLHSLTAFLMGVLILASADPNRPKHIRILLFPILLHLLFNFLIIQKGDFAGFLLMLVLVVPFGFGVAILLLNSKKLA